MPCFERNRKNPRSFHKIFGEKKGRRVSPHEEEQEQEQNRKLFSFSLVLSGRKWYFSSSLFSQQQPRPSSLSPSRGGGGVEEGPEDE